MVNANSTPPSRSRVPPYLPWAQLEDFLDRIRALNPRVIDVQYLETNGFGGSSPVLVLASIRFLRLVQDNRPTTEALDSLKVRGEEEYRSALGAIVRNAYHELFEAMDVSQATRDTVYNQIRTVYQVSPRVASTATPVFLNLCSLANIQTSVTIQPAGHRFRIYTRPSLR